MRKVTQGGRFIDPSLVDAIVFKDSIDGETPPHDVLSNREYQVLQRIAAGESINDIARTFSLSAKTISTHKLRLMKKLGVANNMELIRYALAHCVPG
jgi:DNA-binding NarL/FixJ family response regulator